MLPPAKKRATLGTSQPSLPLQQESSQPENDEEDKTRTLHTEHLESFPLNGDLLIRTPDISCPHSNTLVKATMRSIDDNHFDHLYLKHLFKSGADSNNKLNFYNHRLPLLLGGLMYNETKFSCINCNINSNNKQNISFENDLTVISESESAHNCQNNDFSKIGLNCAKDVLSFYIENDREHGNVIIVINTRRHNGPVGYNLYSIDNDAWLLKNFNRDAIIDYFDLNNGARALLFENRLLVAAYETKIYFYNLSNLMEPKFIGSYKMSHGDWTRHGMVCISKNKSHIEIVMFGGFTGMSNYGVQSTQFSQTFVKLSITCDFDKLNDIKQMEFLKSKLCVQDEKINVRVDDSVTNDDNKYAFGSCQVLNARNERIICIGDKKAMLLFNCSTNELKQIDLLKFRKQATRCRCDPSLISHGDHVHIVVYRTHCLLNLRRLLKDEGRFADLNTWFFWEQERILWIAYAKNADNAQCAFGKKTFSKDLLRHIVSFLRVVKHWSCI